MLSSFLPKPTGKDRSVSTTALATALKRYEGRPGPLPFRNASAGFYRGYNDIAAALPEVVDLVAATPGMILQINTLGGAITTSDVPSVYPHRDFAYLGEIQAYWEQPAREAPLMAAVAKVQRIFHAAGVRAHYRNYPDATFEDPLVAYYGDKGLGFLEMMKWRFDPDDIIRHAQSVKPAR